MTNDILFERAGDWGVITLNREKALNALTWDMVKAMRAQLAKLKQLTDSREIVPI